MIGLTVSSNGSEETVKTKGLKILKVCAHVIVQAQPGPQSICKHHDTRWLQGALLIKWACSRESMCR